MELDSTVRWFGDGARFRLQAEAVAPAAPVSFALHGAVAVDGSGSFSLQELGGRADIDGEVVTLSAGPLRLDDSGRLVIEHAKLESDSIAADLSLTTVDQLASGSLKLDIRDAEPLFRQAGIETGVINHKVFEGARGEVEFRGNLDVMQITRGYLGFGESRLSVSGRIDGGVDPSLSLDFTGDLLDADAVLAAPYRQRVGPLTPLVFPALLRWRDGGITAAFAQFRGGGLVHRDLSLEATSAGGEITLHRLHSALAGGRLQLDGRVAPELPANASFNLRATGVELQQLATAFGSAYPLSGSATVTARGSAVLQQGGLDPGSMAGEVRVSSRGARIHGLDVSAVADALAGSTPAAGHSTLIHQAAASIQVRRGIASNDDLEVDGDGFGISGSGTVDLASERLDYLAVFRIGSADHGIRLPVSLKGSIRDPDVAVEFQRLLRDQLGAIQGGLDPH